MAVNGPAEYGDAGGEDRTAWLAVLICCAALLVIYSFFVVHSPWGEWRNTMAGQSLMRQDDPDAPYLYSAYCLYSHDYPHANIYEGHPGTTLKLLIGGVLTAGVAVIRIMHPEFGPTQAFGYYLTELFIVAKLVMLLANLLAVVAMFLFARRVFRNQWTACYCALGLATYLPFLERITRVAPEGLVILLATLALWTVWEARGALERGKRRVAAGLMLLTAFFSISCLYTKVHYLFAVPVAAFWMAFGIRHIRAKNAGQIGIFAGGCAAFHAVYSLFLGIPPLNFLRLWSRNTHFDTQHVAELLPQLAQKYFFQGRADFLFPVCDVGFVSLCLIGMYLCFRERKEARVLWSGLLLFALPAAAIFVYRRGMHYALPLGLAGAVFFGYAVSSFFGRCNLRCRSAAAVLFILALNAPGALLCIHSRANDVLWYDRASRPYQEALRHSRETGKNIAILRSISCANGTKKRPFVPKGDAFWADRKWNAKRLHPQVYSDYWKHLSPLSQFFKSVYKEFEICGPADNPEALDWIRKKYKVGYVIIESSRGTPKRHFSLAQTP